MFEAGSARPAAQGSWSPAALDQAVDFPQGQTGYWDITRKNGSPSIADTELASSIGQGESAEREFEFARWHAGSVPLRTSAAGRFVADDAGARGAWTRDRRSNDYWQIRR
jgi:hypothetical protein